MVKWWNTVVKWCNKKHVHISIVKWWNKYGAMVQRIHTISNGEMMKHSSGDTLCVKKFYLPEPYISSTDLSDNGEKSWFLSPLAAEPIVSASVVSRWWHFDCLNIPRADPTPFDAVFTAAFDQYISPLHSFRHHQHQHQHQHQGGLYPLPTSSLFTLLGVPVLTIYYTLCVLL